MQLAQEGLLFCFPETKYPAEVVARIWPCRPEDREGQLAPRSSGGHVTPFPWTECFRAALETSRNRAPNTEKIEPVQLFLQAASGQQRAQSAGVTVLSSLSSFKTLSDFRTCSQSSTFQYCKLGAALTCAVSCGVGEHFSFCSTTAEHLPKTLLGWEMPLLVLLLGPDSSPVESSVRIWVSLQPALCSAGEWRGRGGLQQDEEKAGRARALEAGSAGTGLQGRVMTPLGDPQSTCGFRCSACFCPDLLSPSSLLKSLMTLGFHRTLRAAKACSVRMRRVFLFLQSLYLCSFLRSVYTTFHPNPFVPS